ncbi:MAG: D-alanyl-D-alanine carboxypeptidase, partial [Pseudomonadota bacterium]
MRRALALCLALAVPLALPAQALDTTARAALVIDYDTGTVLLEKNADALLPPAPLVQRLEHHVERHQLGHGR